MPVYEYLCKPCHRVFSFYSPTLTPKREPVCPRCGGADMTRRYSTFSVTGTTRKSTGAAATDSPDSAAGGADDHLDDPRVEREMMRLMSEAESIDESDPRQLGRLMRRMSQVTGEPLEGEMEEAVRRLEAGEDPDKIEEDMGEVLGEGDDGTGGGMGMGAPSYDDGLYSF